MTYLIDDLVIAHHQDMANALIQLGKHVPGLDPLLTKFGVRVKVTEFGWVMLIRQIFNWRIVDARNDPIVGIPTEMSGYSRGWCYAGNHSFTLALHAAVAWSGTPDTEPSGWIKSVIDGRRYSEPMPGIRQE